MTSFYLCSRRAAVMTGGAAEHGGKKDKKIITGSGRSPAAFMQMVAPVVTITAQRGKKYDR